VQGEGANAETEAEFADGILTIALGTDAGTAASVTIGEDGDGQIGLTFKQVGDLTGSAYVALNAGENKPVTLAWDGESLAIGLGTDAGGLADDTKNTATLIAAQINLELGEVFTATEAAAGVVDVTAESAIFAGGVDPVVEATAADVVAAVDALDEFSAAEITAGVRDAVDDPVQFSGGVDEVKTLDETEYYVIDGDEKLTAGNPGVVQLSAGPNNIGQVGIDPANNAVQLSGSILAKDPISGVTKELTAMQDNDGNWVLRTVPAALFGYDPVDERWQTEVLNDVTIANRTVEETILLADTEIRNITSTYKEISASLLNKYRDIEIVVKSTLDQKVSISMRRDDYTLSLPLSDGSVTLYHIVAPSTDVAHWIPASAGKVLLSDIVPKTNYGNGTASTDVAPFKKMYFRTGTMIRLHYRCTNAPTTGVFSLSLIGIPN